MSSMNILGTYSGITMDTIDQLIAAEKSKGVKFTNQKSKIEKEQNAWKDVNSRLDSLHKKLDQLTKTETFQTRTVNSNIKESTALKVSADAKASVGHYRVEVKELAQSTRLIGTEVDGVESIYDDLGLTGTLTFEAIRNGEEVILEIDPETGEEVIAGHSIEITEEDSLRDIIDKINATTHDSGVRASIVDNRLVLTDINMGESTITVSTDLKDSEGAVVTDGLGLDGAEQTAGNAAVFTIDGIEITRNTNTIDDVVEGLTFKLSNVHKEGESEIITVASDTQKTTDAVKEFVEQYNSVMSFLEKQLDVGDPSAEGNTTGALTGDSSVVRLQSGLRSLLTGNLDGDFLGAFKNSEEIGITIDRYGVASFDESAFNDALQKDPTSVQHFFFRQETVQVPGTNEEGEENKTSQLQREGMSELLKNFIDTYISTSTTTPGIISTKNTTYDRMLKDISEQIEVFNTRVDKKRDRYIQQFTALDIAMMEAQSQMDYLYSQMGMGQTNQQ